MPITITGAAGVYLSPYSSHRATELGPDTPLHALQLLGQLEDGSAYAPKDWVKVGSATVTVTLLKSADVVAGAVDALRARQKEVRANAEKTAMEIERQIQTLQAITYEPASAG